MPASPMVSIIVPVYNTAEYVEECIQSILAQTYKNIELVLVNDGSTDGSGDICKKYKSLLNVRYIEQENMGVTAARKRGVDESCGEWIMFVDSDDYLFPCAIEVMIKVSEDVDIVIGSNQYNKLKNEPDRISRDQYLSRLYERKLYTGVAPKLFHRTLINHKTLNSPREISYGEDWLMNLQISIDNKKDVSICQIPVYYYRDNPTSSCHQFCYSMDYISSLCNKADEIVASEGAEIRKTGAAIMRMRLICSLLKYHINRIDKNHPFITEIKDSLKSTGNYRLSYRLLLNFPSRGTYRLYTYISRIKRKLSSTCKLKGF